MGNNKNSIYRKAALEHISTPEQLNYTIQVTSPRTWIILITLCLLLLAVILWSIFGIITTRVQGEGILLPGEGGLYNAVAPKGNARIVRIMVKPGDQVKKNQIVVYLDSPELLNQIQTVENALAALQQKYRELMLEASAAIKQHQQELADQRANLKNVIKEQTQNLSHVIELLKVRENALKKGLVTKQEVVASWQSYYGTRREIQAAQEKIIELQMNENAFQDQWKQRQRDLDLKIKDKTQELNTLTVQLKTTKYVTSPIEGRVTSIQAQLGDMVKDGEPIISIAPIKNSLDVVAYVPAQDGKKIQRGMKALVTPSIIKKEEFGSIVGFVNFVAPYPSTSEGMNAIIQNPDLVKRLLEQRYPLEIRISLTPDTKSYSGLKWTSAKGPLVKVTPGTIVETNIIVRKQRPISLILPALKKLMGE